MSHAHERTNYSCGHLASQCRCPSLDKRVTKLPYPCAECANAPAMSPTPSDARCAQCGEDRDFWWHGDVHPSLERDAEKAHTFVPPTRVDEAPEGEPTKRNVPAQEEVVCALWDFARALGIPKNMDTTRPIMDACGPALERIMAAFNCRVTEIQ